MAEIIAGAIATAILGVLIIIMIQSKELQNEQCYIDKLGEGVVGIDGCPGESPSRCMDCRYYTGNN